jgi:hypothetical protein
MLRYNFKTFNLYFQNLYHFKKHICQRRCFLKWHKFYLKQNLFFGNHISFSKKIKLFLFFWNLCHFNKHKSFFINDIIFAKKKLWFIFFLNLHQLHGHMYFSKWKFWKEASEKIWPNFIFWKAYVILKKTYVIALFFKSRFGGWEGKKTAKKYKFFLIVTLLKWHCYQTFVHVIITKLLFIALQFLYKPMKTNFV